MSDLPKFFCPDCKNINDTVCVPIDPDTFQGWMCSSCGSLNVAQIPGRVADCILGMKKQLSEWATIIQNHGFFAEQLTETLKSIGGEE